MIKKFLIVKIKVADLVKTSILTLNIRTIGNMYNWFWE